MKPKQRGFMKPRGVAAKLRSVAVNPRSAASEATLFQPHEANTPKCRIHDVTYPEIGLLRQGLRNGEASRMGRRSQK